jgi:hypothetical protein
MECSSGSEGVAPRLFDQFGRAHADLGREIEAVDGDRLGDLGAVLLGALHDLGRQRDQILHLLLLHRVTRPSCRRR